MKTRCMHPTYETQIASSSSSSSSSEFSLQANQLNLPIYQDHFVHTGHTPSSARSRPHWLPWSQAFGDKKNHGGSWKWLFAVAVILGILFVHFSWGIFEVGWTSPHPYICIYIYIHIHIVYPNITGHKLRLELSTGSSVALKARSTNKSQQSHPFVYINTSYIK